VFQKKWVEIKNIAKKIYGTKPTKKSIKLKNGEHKLRSKKGH
jgi:hypothetical protein